MITEAVTFYSEKVEAETLALPSGILAKKLATIEEYARVLGYSVKVEFEPRIH